MSAPVFITGLEPGVVSPGFRLAGVRRLRRGAFAGLGKSMEQMTDEELMAELSQGSGDAAKALDSIQKQDPTYKGIGTSASSVPRGGGEQPITRYIETSAKGGGAMDFLTGGIGDMIKNVLGQGSAAGSQFTSSIAALQQGEAARERARTMKLLGGGLIAVAVIGGGIFALTKLSKRGG